MTAPAPARSDRDAPAATTTTTRAFDSSAAATFTRSTSLSRIPRLAFGAEPASPQPTLARTEAPSSCTSESTSSRLLGLRALDNGTPSRLAQFRAKNWLRGGAGKKRALESSDTSAQPPKRRAVTSLFSDEPAQESVAAIATTSSTSTTSSNSSTIEPIGTSDAVQEPLADATASSQSPPQSTDNSDDTRLWLQHEIKVATCLAQDLKRDNARLELQTDALRDDIDFYYALLTKVEAVVHAARRQSSSGSSSSPGSELAGAIKRIISAPRTPHAAAKAGSVERET